MWTYWSKGSEHKAASVLHGTSVPSASLPCHHATTLDGTSGDCTRSWLICPCILCSKRQQIHHVPAARTTVQELERVLVVQHPARDARPVTSCRRYGGPASRVRRAMASTVGVEGEWPSADSAGISGPAGCNAKVTSGEAHTRVWIAHVLFLARSVPAMTARELTDTGQQGRVA
jgi:hypothetical protein